MKTLSLGDCIAAMVIAMVCVLMMVGARALFAAPDHAPAQTAHAYIP